MAVNYNRQQLYWRCRRGMLELDIILISFFEKHFDLIDNSLQNDFVALLKCEDPELYSWLMGFEEVPESFTTIINTIQHYVQQNH